MPAGTEAKTLKVYAGVIGCGARLEATLVNAEGVLLAAPISILIRNSGWVKNVVETIQFQAPEDGATLKVRYVFNNNDWGNAVWLSAATLDSADVTAPTAPTNLILENKTSTTATLSWDPSFDNVGVTSYDIYVSETKMGTVPATSTSYMIQGIPSSVSGSSFTVKAKDAQHNTSVGAQLFVIDTYAPAMIADLYVTNKTSNSISLDWPESYDNIRIIGYKVSWGSNSITTTNSQYTINGLAGGTQYNIAVAAINALGNVSEDRIISETTTEEPIIVPPTITPPAPTTPPTPTVPVVTPTPIPTPTPYMINIGASKNEVDKIFEGEVTVSTKGDKAILSIQMSTEKVLEFVKESGATPSKPVQLSLSLPESKMIDLISDKDVQSVRAAVVISSELLKNSVVKIEELNIVSTILEAAKTDQKDINISVVDEKGKVQYEWSFIGKKLNDITDVNLALEVMSANKLVNSVLEKDNKNTQGVAVHFNQEGTLSGQVKVYVGDHKFIKSGKKVYVYRYNETIGKLETIKGGYNYKMDADGYITINVLDSSTYVILPNEANKSVYRSLRNQINIDSKQKTMNVSNGETMQLSISMPDSMKWVNSLGDAVPKGVAAATITFKTSDKTVATVNKDGKITAKGVGKTTITATITLYSGKQNLY